MSARYGALSAAQRRLLLALLPGQGLNLPPAWADADLQARVQSALERRLPDYMVPRQSAVLPAFPLTRNGKVDVAALPDPVAGTVRESTGPRSPLEGTVLLAFQAVLGQEDIGIHDDFFILGGDSLLATQLAVHLGGALGMTLPVALAFSRPTVAGLAAGIEALERAARVVSPAPATAPEAGEELPDLLGLDDPDFELERPTRDLRTDVTLDADIRPAPGAASVPPGAWREVLLTGATGYFGSHLLAELLARTDWTVHLLVRADSVLAALDRVRSAARRFCPHAQDTWDESRLRVHPGDLTQPHFGWSPAGYEERAGRLDAVFHAGAGVNFAYPYASLKPVNVDALQEVFRFAARGQLKAVQFVSSIHLFSSSRLLGRPLIREDEDITALPGVTGGYAQSRWVGEGIAGLARTRGVPVTVYRPSIIGGDTRSGVSNENDALCRLFRGCVQLGVVPQLRSALNFVTADYASAGLLALARDPQATGGTYHLVNPRQTPLQDVTSGLVRFGYDLQITDFGDWQARIEAAGPDNALYTLLPIIAHLGVGEATGLRPPHFDDARARALLAPQGLTCPDLTHDLQTLYLSGMVRSGYLPAPVGRVT